MQLGQLNPLDKKNALNRARFRLCKNTEKLSSGYQINSAGDNAAGLAVSEKMRSLIVGLSMASRNSNDGISLIQVGEGALQEVHSMLHRIREMAVQSSNGVYCDEVDREGLQMELEAIRTEVDRIAGSTDFNGINLFQDEGYEAECDVPWYRDSLKSTARAIQSDLMAAELPLKSAADTASSDTASVVVSEIVYDFSTVKSLSNYNNFTDAADIAIADTLKKEIVPNVVNGVMNKYTAFDYLTGSSIGIGLELKSEPGSSTLASVTSSVSSGSNGFLQGYKLTVNTAKVDLSTEAGRKALERTISHEMIHTFMNESLTSGMHGLKVDGSLADPFPMWFIEGMAQTASGPGNWVKSSSGLGLDSSSTLMDIQNALSVSGKRLADSDASPAAQYGTGYLACMYLGYKAYTHGGGTIDMSSPTGAAAGIASGLSDFLGDMVQGSSLQKTVEKYTGYTTLDAFQNGFATDSQAQNFVKGLLNYATDGLGGLISGSLSNDDPVPNGAVSNPTLFALNSSYKDVKNSYPSQVNVISGGAAVENGVPPIKHYPDDLFSVSGGTEGTDWSFDNTTGVLTILSGADLTISGGTKTVDGVTYVGRIVVKDGVGNAAFTIDGVDIDMSKDPAGGAGIHIGDGNKVAIKIQGENNIKGGGKGAGIQLPGGSGAAGSELTIDGTGTLNVTGGSNGSIGGAAIGAGYGQGDTKSSIVINGGTINAKGGYGAAAIGAAQRSDIGDITITGGKISAVADHHGAGIGGGWIPSKVGNITITGGDIYASGVEHGTGIGSGCQGTVGNITISGAGTKVVAKGGNDGAGIGASWNGRAGEIRIDGGKVNATGGRNGAGIGSGLDAKGGDIIINGGEVTAKGATDAAGIGSGRNGTNTGIYINGGVVTAEGGLTNNGGNIGAYLPQTAVGEKPDSAPLEIAPGLTIKAGSGEGLYNTTGATEADGTPVFGFKLDKSYLPSDFEFPISAKTTTGKGYTWTDLQHMDEEAIYIWMNGEDHKLDITDKNGNTTTIDLEFFPDSGMWRKRGEEAPPPAEKPTYSDGTEPPDYAGKPQPEPEKKPVGERGIILQIGARKENILVVPQFYFSAAALKMEELDVSTRDKANDTIEKVDVMINRVSMIRGEYGALHNTLEHVINNLNTTHENIMSAESCIRDTDMAMEMTKYVKNNIVSQTSQAMLAQANGQLQQVLQLLQ